MRKNKMLFATATSIAAIAFNGDGWKKDADGKIVVDGNGNPILVTADGKEMSVQQTTVSALNAENRTYRERAEAAENALEPFKGLDATKAREALETVQKIDRKTLIDAGEVDRVRNEIGQQYQTQLNEKDTALNNANERVNSLLLDQAFSRSKFIADQVAVPREMFEATFGKNFKIEDGKAVAYDAAGNRMMSKKNLGEIASVDEAFEIMVESYPHKDTILKAPDQRGSGGSGGGNQGTGRVVRRADFDALAPHEKASVAAQSAKGEIKIVD